ncbi:hypothetical protein UF16_00965 [Chromobacterium violaceum]|nr:hypothetical protein UF16_00965 [Chromobacterium violaceum]
MANVSQSFGPAERGLRQSVAFSPTQIVRKTAVYCISERFGKLGTLIEASFGKSFICQRNGNDEIVFWGLTAGEFSEQPAQRACQLQPPAVLVGVDQPVQGVAKQVGSV